MNRRTVLGRLSACVVAISAMPLLSRTGFADSNPEARLAQRRFLLIGDTRDASTTQFLAELSPYIAESHPEWLRNFRALDIHDDAVEIGEILAKYGPNTTSISWPLIVVIPEASQYTDRSEVAVGLWSRDWLAFRKTRAITDACYPVSNSQHWWSVEGDWNPSAAKVRTHLFHSPNHTDAHFTSEWLAELRLEELQSAHSDHHEEMAHTAGYRLRREYVNRECPRDV